MRRWLNYVINLFMRKEVYEVVVKESINKLNDIILNIRRDNNIPSITIDNLKSFSFNNVSGKNFDSFNNNVIHHIKLRALELYNSYSSK